MRRRMCAEMQWRRRAKVIFFMVMYIRYADDYIDGFIAFELKMQCKNADIQIFHGMSSPW